MDETAILFVVAAIAYYLYARKTAPAGTNSGATSFAAGEYSGYSSNYTYGYNNAYDYNSLPVATADASTLTLSQEGADFIKQKEGLRLTPYLDINGFSAGYGHHFQNGEPVPPVLTMDQAEAYFESDVAACIAAIQSSVTVPLSQGQFDALVDFIYNEGVGAFQRSTLLQKLNSGDYTGAAQELSRWTIAGGVQNTSLVSRRSGEYQLWNA